MSTSTETRKDLAVHCNTQAEKYLVKGNYARAFSHYLVSSKLSPDAKVTDALVFTLRELGLALEKACKYEELFNCYQQALEIFPDSPEIQNNFGAHLFRLGKVEEAATYFLQAVTLNPRHDAAKENLDNVSNALMERWHYPMLNDQQRNNSYRSAIKAAVQEGYNTVLDIGAGTGILSMCAVQCGAKTVYACEISNVMYMLSNSILKDNGCAGMVKLFNKHSTELSIPDHIPNKVSLVVTEIVDGGLLGEQILPTLAHAWKHLLLPSRNDQLRERFGKVIPAGATVWASCVECVAIRKKCRVLNSYIGGITLECLKTERATDLDPYTTERLDTINDEVQFLINPIRVTYIDFNNPKEIEKCINGFSLHLTTKFVQSGTVDAIVTWFTLNLDDNHSLSTAANTCWEQAVYPIHSKDDLKVMKDQTLKLEARVNEDAITFPCLTVSDEKETLMTTIASFNPANQFSTLTHNDILKLNDVKYWQFIVAALDTIKVDNVRVLDLSSFPLGGLIALQRNADVTLEENGTFHAVLSKVASANGIDFRKVNTISHQEALTNAWNLVILDVVEPTGILRQDILEDLTLLRYSCQSVNGRFIPDRISVQAVLVESLSLVEMNQLLNDERVLGFKIAQSINKFKVSTHLDVNLNQLPHKLLSKPTEIMNFNFSDYSNELINTDASSMINIKSTNNGWVHAVAYWFKLHYGGKILDTLEHGFVWKQAFVVLDSPIQTFRGQELILNAKCNHSCVRIKIEMPD